MRDGVVRVAQPELTDLHFSVHHAERAYDFRWYVGPAMAMVNPDLVPITGDLNWYAVDPSLLPAVLGTRPLFGSSRFQDWSNERWNYSICK